MKIWKLALLAPLVLLGLLPGSSGHTAEPHAAVLQAALAEPAFTFTVTGQKQGVLMGDGSVNQIRGLSYDYEVKSPRDLATGAASGKRQYSPITITKLWGPSSPQFLKALATNELLPAVQLTFSSGSNSDGPILNHTISLTNAFVIGIHHHPATGLMAGSTDKQQVEDITFTFQKIEMRDFSTNTGFSDIVN